MRSRPPDTTDPVFLDEKTARKQAERQVLLDALSGGLQAEAIEWAAGSAIAPMLLASPRIQLRPWKDADREPFAAMTADPEVMRHFPATLSREDEFDHHAFSADSPERRCCVYRLSRTRWSL